MPATKISALTAITGVDVAAGDLWTLVDVSDTTMAVSGTNKKITAAETISAIERLSPQISYLAATRIY